MSKPKRSSGSRLSIAVMIFYALAFLLPAGRDGDMMGYILAGAVPAMIFVGTFILPHLFPTDRLLMSLTNFLCAMGVLLLYATNRDLALQQAIFYGAGLVAMIVCIYLVRGHTWRRAIPLLIPVSLALLALPVLVGQEINGAKNWFAIGPISFQPSELVKLALIVVLAYFLSRRRHWPWLLFAVACLGVLLLQADLGTALLYYGTTLLLFWCSTGNAPASLLGLAGGCGAAWYGYQTFAHVRLRVAIWQDPWADVENAGYQLVKGLTAIAQGGLWGVGLGMGNPKAIPVYESDFIFAVLCNQFGLIFGCCVLAMYIALIWRGTTIAVSARRSFHGLLAMGAVLMLGLQTFIIIGGVLKVIPLTGVTLPFISYGGTSLVASMCLVGFIQGVESLNEDAMQEDARMAMLER